MSNTNNSLIVNSDNVKFTKDSMVNNTFYVTYAFLLTTMTVTFIEAISTKDAKIRHIMNLETVISIVAAYFYKQFMDKLNITQELGSDSSNSKKKDYASINVTRYMDWAITTPVMLWALCLVLGYNNGVSLNGSFFLLILVLNYAMLGAGYLGETKQMNKRRSTILGFVFFFALYAAIYMKYLHVNNVFDNQIIFWAFVVFWTGYGILHEKDDETKNIGYNILDLFSKCFVGIFFWAYLTKSIDIFN
jgi:bacteriorhodopsin